MAVNLHVTARMEILGLLEPRYVCFKHRLHFCTGGRLWILLNFLLFETSHHSHYGEEELLQQSQSLSLGMWELYEEIQNLTLSLKSLVSTVTLPVPFRQQTAGSCTATSAPCFGLIVGWNQSVSTLFNQSPYTDVFFFCFVVFFTALCVTAVFLELKVTTKVTIQFCSLELITTLISDINVNLEMISFMILILVDFSVTLQCKWTSSSCEGDVSGGAWCSVNWPCFSLYCMWCDWAAGRIDVNIYVGHEWLTAD